MVGGECHDVLGGGVENCKWKCDFHHASEHVSHEGIGDIDRDGQYNVKGSGIAGVNANLFAITHCSFVGSTEYNRDVLIIVKLHSKGEEQVANVLLDVEVTATSYAVVDV